MDAPLFATSCLYSGSLDHPIYLDVLTPTRGDAGKLPMLMLHGAFHTGSAYLTTPDGRPGWAPYFASHGRPVYVMDWPGHGRSPATADFHLLSGEDIVRSTTEAIKEIGPCILLAHSAGGPIAWRLAEILGEHVRGIVGIAPGGPANLQRPLPDDPELIHSLRDDEEAGCPIYADPTRPFLVDMAFIRAYWANTPRFPAAAIERYARSIVAESPRILNERFRIGGSGLMLDAPAAIGSSRPVLILTGEHDPRHPRETDERVAHYLNGEYCYLPDRGIFGNGHMLMLDDNSDDLAALIDHWLSSRGI